MEIPTHQENVLYLIDELDEALTRRMPTWTPEQLTLATRRMVSLAPLLLEMVSKRGPLPS
jgi:hypothetical protein